MLGKNNTVIGRFEGDPIAVLSDKYLGLSFHPELNGVTLFHESLFRGSVNSNFQAPGNINAA